MNQDFRVSVSFLNHPKTIRLRHKLKDAGLVGVLGLWSHAAAHNWNGRLEGYTAKDVARASGWMGSANKFLDTLLECGFLDVLPSKNGYLIHDWGYWNEYATKALERIEKGRRAANARHRPGQQHHATSNATSIDFASCPLPPDTPVETTRYKKIAGSKI